MLLLAVKAGFGFAVILVISGVVQAQSLSDILVAFAAAGIVPGTNLQVPPDLALIAAGAALMVVTALLFKDYFTLQAKIEAAAQEQGYFAEDPAFEVLVPGLKRLADLRRSARSRTADVLLATSFWVRSLGRPIVAQAIAVRRGVAGSLIRFDGQASISYWIESLGTAFYRLRRHPGFGARLLQQVAEKTRSAARAVYLVLASMV